MPHAAFSNTDACSEIPSLGCRAEYRLVAGSLPYEQIDMAPALTGMLRPYGLESCRIYDLQVELINTLRKPRDI